MSGTEFQFAFLSDQRLAAHALSPLPVWLWSADATRVLWSNPGAAAIFDAASPGALAAVRFDLEHAAAAQVLRLAGTLPQGGAARLERLRGFGAGSDGTLPCLCSHFVLADNTPAVLVVATERAGEDMSLPDRAQRLLADIEWPAAIFSADGELIAAGPTARERFGDKSDLIALGAERFAREASLNGRAEGDIAGWPAILLRLGAGSTVTLLAAFVPPEQSAGAEIGFAVTQAAPTDSGQASGDLPARRFPSRFVWQIDAANRFTLGTEDFAKMLGPKTMAVLGRPWADVAAELKLDPQGAVANALAARGTWSGIVVPWPIEGEDQPLPIEMSGLPIFGRDREFAGYRGFGICRDVDRLTALEQRRAQATSAPAEAKGETPADKRAGAGRRAAGAQCRRAQRFRGVGARTQRPAQGRIRQEYRRAAAGQCRRAPAAPVRRTVRGGDAARDVHEGRPILDRMPVGILVYRLNTLLYANRAFLDWTGYPSLEALSEAGGLDSLFIDTKDEAPAGDAQTDGKSLTISTVNGDPKPVEGRLISVPWNGENALVLMISTHAVAEDRSKPVTPRRLEIENDELKSILDTATDGVIVLDRAGRVLSASRSAQALFGYEAAELAELDFGDLFAPESQRAVLDYLDRLTKGSSVLDAGCEAIGKVRQGGLVPLHFTMGRIAGGEKFCAVMRDITAWKRSEEELINAKQEAEKASTAKSEFLAKISHEIRTPLNAIIGFSAVMMDERFGPLGNERYRQYLKDIHNSGEHLISLLNDLLDLSKIEAGKLELTFVSVDLNDIVQQCVAIMQQEANRERVIIRTSLPQGLPPIMADARSVRQIALNLLSNSIKFTGAGGQVIVATALNDDQELVLRVRDTGPGMSEKELQIALEPFRQIATASRAGGAGLGLPISKALAEANHARFRITSAVDSGTLAEVAFPVTRVLAQ